MWNVPRKIRITVVLLGIVLATGLLGHGADGPVDASDRLAKLAARLKQFDTNGNGMIDADEAAPSGAKLYMESRVFDQFGIQPHYPIAINEILKTAAAKWGVNDSSLPPPQKGGDAHVGESGGYSGCSRARQCGKFRLSFRSAVGGQRRSAGSFGFFAIRA